MVVFGLNFFLVAWLNLFGCLVELVGFGGWLLCWMGGLVGWLVGWLLEWLFWFVAWLVVWLVGFDGWLLG